MLLAAYFYKGANALLLHHVMTKLLSLLVFCSICNRLIGQPASSDSLPKGNQLAEVVVTVYENRARLMDVPAAINYVSPSLLNRSNYESILPTLNTLPGVKMEQRSPGSYRLNIRGSSMRAPFGVRNVKVYYNGIPFTDPGGNTYLNQLGALNFKSIEIIKGPGSSLYGAGTGGVVLINGLGNEHKSGASAYISAASYQTKNLAVEARIGGESWHNAIAFQHQKSDGYRQQTAMRRDVFSWNASFKTNAKTSVTTTFLYGDLFYETPGALTFAEYQLNPKAARPRVANTPGAIENKAAIYQKTALAGASIIQTLNAYWQNTTTVYAAFSNIKNPSIRNFERRTEPHFGGRSVWQYHKKINNLDLSWHVGGELQQSYNNIMVFSNKAGNADTLQTNDEINNAQRFIFSQAVVSLSKWVMTLGISLNQYNLNALRLSNRLPTVNKIAHEELAPRVALLRKITPHVNMYASIAKGFSPPSSAEILPSNSVLNTSLQAEKGLNIESGVKGSILNNRLFFDVNSFLFNLSNTIVQRRDVSGADLFINAGSTKQWGIETQVNYQIVPDKNRFWDQSRIWSSYTYSNFSYKQFQQVTNNFSGNRMPGIAPHTVSFGLDVMTIPGFYLNLTQYHTTKIPLNDANSDYAKDYNLLDGKIGFSNKCFGIKADIYLGVNNLLDDKYSLGNDINGFGGRFYNAGPKRNYFIGLALTL